MPFSSLHYRVIGLARENESPENPGSLEKRVALIPKDVKKLTQAGCSVFVEAGAGEGVGFKDADYVKAGASIQSTDEIYRDKDLLIKFKGPALEHIPLMRPGCTLFCMAHFHSFPERAKLLEAHRITVIAMEHIVEAPKRRKDEEIIGRMAADACLETSIRRNMHNLLNIYILGYRDGMQGMIRRFANQNPHSMSLLQPDQARSEKVGAVRHGLFVIDSTAFPETVEIAARMKPENALLFDVGKFRSEKGKAALRYYKSVHAPALYGLRRIQCLHETGMAGARYGFRLLKEVSPLQKAARDAEATVLGYGNVGMGAIHECYRQGVRKVNILGRFHTKKDRIETWLKRSDVVINGAEQPVELRGKNFLVSNRHLREVMRKGSVLIDLIGGSATNRSPVEPVVECTYLTDPHFEQDGIFVSALWGWPMMGMMKETAVRYSGQIADVLLGDDEHLIGGLTDPVHPGVKPAVVCGPF
ncbi:Alanine dehydrogenase/PNT, N-terminal domain [Cyclonatronum proteinivorum]|uniref:Alanine dehydrogenase/PNT, N-terminal domain n=1 Tax=Cyclonatronum proteinivorum TaxID=1457365 RepID=A0A345UGK0_9BACT|nr:alanine dehydrogenase [Cyclonatronum proteinivorum]AXI99601.1 Alanine dehydrogenase/PNT, N-terminal domain [Cyclonatronum proteinivorum]